MTGTDERRSSRSRSRTPDRGDNFVPQPVFLPHPGSNSQRGTPQPVLPPATAFVYAPQMQGIQPPVMGDDPFRIYVPEHPGIIDLNDDMPEMWNAPQRDANMQGPDPQGGGHFQWPPIPIQPPVPAQPPAQIVAGVRRAAANRHHAARQPHPQYPTKLWCTRRKHWVESAVFGSLLTCEACRASDRARTARLREEQLAQEAQAIAELQLAAEKELLVAEGAKVMLTRNLWTSKGLVNGAQGVVKKIWFDQGSNARSHLPAVIFVKFDGYSGPETPAWQGIDGSNYTCSCTMGDQSRKSFNTHTISSYASLGYYYT